MKVFLSIGSTSNPEQEIFVQAIEERLRAEGLVPQTLGRNAWTAEAPLQGVRDLMDQCQGILVIALERYFYPEGIERRGGEKEAKLSKVCSSTAWNQIEASMAYTKGLPLMVVVSKEVRGDGLLEEGYDWYVQRVEPVPDSLNTPEFNGVLASWKQMMLQGQNVKSDMSELSELTVGSIIKAMKPAQFWSICVAIAAGLAGAFALGTKFPSP